jgi:hypothetical protein
MSTLSAFARHVAGYWRSQSPGAELFQPGPNDVYLASYPRSGNTWLRAVVAEIMFGSSGANIADLDRYVPDIYVPQPNENIVPAKFHVVKTHEPYHHEQRKRLKRAIYIFRDPRDVAVSFYRYLHGLGKYDGTLDAFLADWLAGRIWPCSWREHVVSWAGDWPKVAPHEWLVFRYEDMLREPAAHVRTIAQFLGFSLEGSRLNDVLGRTTSDEMRRKEKAGMRSTERATGFQFIGGAKAGGWRESLSVQQAAVVTESLGPLMSQFGYNPNGVEDDASGMRNRAA